MGGEAFVTFNPRRSFNFYWNNNSILLPKSVDLPQVSASIYSSVSLSFCTSSMKLKVCGKGPPPACIFVIRSDEK